MFLDFQNKRVVVTGGTKGLGRAITRAFAHRGAWVAAAYSSDEESASATGSELEEMGAEYLLSRCDVSVKEDVNRMMGMVLKEWEYVDILVNNAGIIRDKMLMFLDEEDWNPVMDINLKGTYLCSRAVLKEMISRKSGRIINMGSPSGLTGMPGQTNYSSSKGGVVSFTKSLAREVARLGITVNTVIPGVIDTPMTDALDKSTRERLLKMIPTNKFGTPHDVANTVLFLASDRASYMTGQSLAVDGGLT